MRGGVELIRAATDALDTLADVRRPLFAPRKQADVAPTSIPFEAAMRLFKGSVPGHHSRGIP